MSSAFLASQSLVPRKQQNLTHTYTCTVLFAIICHYLVLLYNNDRFCSLRIQFHNLACLSFFQLQEKDSELSVLMESLKKMRRLAQELVVSEEYEGDTSLSAQCIKAMKLKDDEGYFDTYSHFSIHHEMLSVSLKAVTVMHSLAVVMTSHMTIIYNHSVSR